MKKLKPLKKTNFIYYLFFLGLFSGCFYGTHLYGIYDGPKTISIPPPGGAAITIPNDNRTVPVDVVENLLSRTYFLQSCEWDDTAKTIKILYDGKYSINYESIFHPLEEPSPSVTGHISLMLNGTEKETADVTLYKQDVDPLKNQYRAKGSLLCDLHAGDVLFLQGVANCGMKLDLGNNQTCSTTYIILFKRMPLSP
jgi:hypothetical protein